VSITMHDVAASLRCYHHEGVNFFDVNSITSSGQKWRHLIDTMAKATRTTKIDLIVGLDARGFLFSGALAYVLAIGKVMGRKRGKLPGKTISTSYGLEYRAHDELELQTEHIRPGMHVLIVDDVLATGGTALAAAKLIERLGGRVAGVMVAIELPALSGRAKLGHYPVYSAMSVIEDIPTAEVEYCVDVIAKTIFGTTIMVNRLTEPFGIAFPGGRIDSWESAERAVYRELFEETAFQAGSLQFVTTLAKVGRDPRGPKVALVYRTVVSGESPFAGERGKTEVLTCTPAMLTALTASECAFDVHDVLRTYVLPKVA